MLKVMIVGAGAIAPAHIEGFLSFPERVEITHISNPTVAKAAALIDKYGLNAEASSLFDEQLDAVDIVSICSPPSTHRDLAVKALEAGKHVLLEKPMAMSLGECDQILSAAEKGNALISVVAQSRFISSISNTMKIIHKGDYGKLLFSQINSFWWRGQSYYDLYWRGLWESEGGGCTLNHAVHHIDLLLWAKGLPVEVNSFLTNLNHQNSEEEDLSLSILKYADGTMSQINASLIHHGEEQKLDFQMEKASVSIPFAVKASTPRSNGFPMDDEETINKLSDEYKNLPDLKFEHHAGQVGNFLDAIEKGTPLAVSGKDGRNSIELISAVYKSAFTGSGVILPLKKDDPYYSFPSRVEDATRFHKKTKSVKGFDDSTITDFKGRF
ncbi:MULTISPECIES: Gfo/Idh/MocA family protein [unclassified Oceanispirochaeta]|uniref:Gfo/Idh/MocA family protein n=1 Tax=unclassified Oceanispirochaeta TaxID=2635722 RepID=UPI000E08ECCC|nr:MULTISPECIES: Gfo/Idh/MocA family oxidoreductase [unclassified Oceanispirochaeta]MBF9014496.1 Gfo/Idh/MocA family oxidoreductase [Oceanispirochaeta sp. M2]NPD70752.1 Gfo/Idh/MocA family oxidoreductase [Oceanispirochaeta sp. M1]RDG34033.1 gfo/Idh/MocA family oxidoreductase [Oceanispirochaeta sp. M1]